MFIFSLFCFITLYFVINYRAKKKFYQALRQNGEDIEKNSVQVFHRMKNYALYVSIVANIIAIGIFVVAKYISNIYILKLISPPIQDKLIGDILKNKIKQLSSNSSEVTYDQDFFAIPSISKEQLLELAQQYSLYTHIANITILCVCISIVLCILFVMNRKLSIHNHYQKNVEKSVQIFMLMCCVIAIFTTFGIIVSLLIESFRFFQHVDILNFLFGTQWRPENAHLDPQHSFGIIPLLVGTFMIALLSVSFALPLGMLSAVYMSEYMSIKRRKIIQPILESLAGIPSIVYGFFAATTVSQLVIKIGNLFDLKISTESALPVSIVISVMILPFISSTILEVLDNIPKEVREGGYGMGSMKHEVILKVLIPGALPGIVAGTLLAVSRAVGESMVIVMAASIIAKLTLNPLDPVTTITGQIVTIMKGDQAYGSPQMLSAFALGLTLFVITLILNVMAMKIVNSHNKKYN